MVMIALQFIINEKVSFSNEYPLLSAYDVRNILIRIYSKKKCSADEVLIQLKKRHDQTGLEELKSSSTQGGKVELINMNLNLNKTRTS